MSTEVTLPALGESVTEGTISRWLKEVGEQVSAQEPLLEVSTDKVDTEVPSPASGTLLEIKYDEDDVAEVGAVIAIIGDANEAPAVPAPAAPAPAQAVAPEAQAQQAPTGQASGTEIKLPELGEGVNQAVIARWLKEVGEEVEAGEPVLEVSTDKVDTEIPAPAAGTLLEVRANEDEEVTVGSVLGIIGDASAAPAPQPTAPAPQQAAPAAPQPPAPQPPAPRPSAPSPAAPTASAPAPVAAPRAAGSKEVYVTPLVRKMARDLGVDLSTIEGTGVGGRIRKQDVQAAAEAAKAPAPQAAPETKPAAGTPAGHDEDKRGTTEKLPRMRQIIAQRMNESLETAAQLTATVEVDLTGIANLRKKVKDDFRSREGVGLTYLAFIAKATVETLQKFPIFNASMSLEEKTITYHGSENLGIAVASEKGLMVPVIKEAGDLNVGGLAKAIADVAKRVRSNSIKPDELSGSTFTITNYGGNGSLFDTPIINQPNSAIMGTGALVKRPVVVTDEFGNDTIAVRQMMYISLTYDHRLIDGALAGDFLSAIKARLESGDFGAEFGA